MMDEQDMKCQIGYVFDKVYELEDKNEGLERELALAQRKLQKLVPGEVEKRMLEEAKSELFDRCFMKYFPVIISLDTTEEKFAKQNIHDLPDYMSVEQFFKIFYVQIVEVYEDALDELRHAEALKKLTVQKND